MFGDEINYEDEFQINGEFFTDNKDTVKKFLEKLGILFLQQNIKYSFEYYEKTEDGQQIGRGI